jgi:hypothetical protein
MSQLDALLPTLPAITLPPGFTLSLWRVTDHGYNLEADLAFDVQGKSLRTTVRVNGVGDAIPSAVTQRCYNQVLEAVATLRREALIVP